MGEPLLIIVIFVSLSMLLPLAFPCTPTKCYIKQGDSKPYCPEGTSSNIRYILLGAVDKNIRKQTVRTLLAASRNRLVS